MNAGESESTSISKRGAIGPFLLVTIGDAFLPRLRRIAREHLDDPALWQVDSVEKAFARIAQRDIVLAIFDLDMPGAPDPEELAKLHRTCREARLVALCGEIGANALLRYIAAGVHGCILKTDPDEVVARRLRGTLAGDLSIPETAGTQADATAPPGHPEETGDHKPINNRVAPHLAPQVLQDLTERQRTVLVLLVEGMTNKEISRELSISTRTVKMHLSAIYRTLGVNNRTQALSVLFKSREP